MRARRTAGGIRLAELILICIVLSIVGALLIPNWVASRRRDAEARAQAALKRIVAAEGVWRMSDFDRNGGQDYWTLDIAGLYGVQQLAGEPCAALDADTAALDAAPAASYPGLPARGSLDGFYAAIVMTMDEDGNAYVDTSLAAMTSAPLSGRVATNGWKYGFCIYPEGSTGSVALQFVVNEEGVVHSVKGIRTPIKSYALVPSPYSLFPAGYPE